MSIALLPTPTGRESPAQLGPLGFVLRAGLEAGREQLTGKLRGDSSVASPHGAVKAYAGTTLNTGRQAFGASVGVQFESGNTHRRSHVVSYQ